MSVIQLWLDDVKSRVPGPTMPPTSSVGPTASHPRRWPPENSDSSSNPRPHLSSLTTQPEKATSTTHGIVRLMLTRVEVPPASIGWALPQACYATHGITGTTCRFRVTGYEAEVPPKDFSQSRTTERLASSSHTSFSNRVNSLRNLESSSCVSFLL